MESKNEIRKRMISAAARSWGISVRDMEKADPLVSLLIDACASEIEKASSSIEDARNTMGNKLMELLTPEDLLSPYPSRGIVYTYPFSTKFKITPEHHFFIQKIILLKRMEYLLRYSSHPLPVKCLSVPM